MLKLSLDDLPWPSLAVDGSGRILHINHELRKRGVIPETWEKRPLVELFPEYGALLQKSLPSPEPTEVVITRQTATARVQERVWLRRMFGWTCLIIMDETRLAELEATREQTARLASMGFLLAGVCHEVGNPLAAINSMIQIMQSSRGLNASTIKKGLPIIATNVKTILNITRKLSNFSRAMTEKPAPFPVDQAIENALLLLRNDRRAEYLDIHHEPLAAAIVRGHASEVQQVFFNVFLNALQAMQGKGMLRVESSISQPGTVEVTVKDSGPGIAPEHMDCVLEPFFTTKPAGEGTGLGLAISYQIVHEHGGEIRVGNNPGGGACFRIQLPLCKSQS